MSVLNKISFYRNRRDEVPNQELARELAETKNKEGINEIAKNLKNKEKSIQSNCMKVLYEIGYINPELIKEYVDDFLYNLNNRNNRMVWGAMIGLSIIAHLKADEMWKDIDTILKATEKGSVITYITGIKVISKIAAAKPEYSKKLFPVLLDYIKTSIPRDVPTNAESMLCAVDEKNKDKFLKALKKRESDMSKSQMNRLKKVYKSF
jgi:hypothetical protein